MRHFLLLLLIGFVYCSEDREARRYYDRDDYGTPSIGLSLFSVVKFKNTQCVSQSIASCGSNRFGTCYTKSECEDNGGVASGSCATGFGVCCLFFVESGDVTQNFTYLVSEAETDDNMMRMGASYKIKKCADDVCSLRIDMITHEIAGPDSESDGECVDTMTISNGAVNYPTICGTNHGQHFYVDFSEDNDIMIQFSLDQAENADRQWELLACQIECTNVMRPPPGCFQYFTEPQGTIMMFNFGDDSTSHLPNQDYTSCIRRRSGVCCVQYSVCDETEPLTLNYLGSWDAIEMTGGILADSRCVEDYIRIQGASASCAATPGERVFNRICGDVFGGAPAQTGRHAPVCDCRPPFHVGFVTDDTTDLNTDVVSRPVCLNYRQIGC